MDICSGSIQILFCEYVGNSNKWDFFGVIRRKDRVNESSLLKIYPLHLHNEFYI